MTVQSKTCMEPRKLTCFCVQQNSQLVTGSTPEILAGRAIISDFVEIVNSSFYFRQYVYLKIEKPERLIIAMSIILGWHSIIVAETSFNPFDFSTSPTTRRSSFDQATNRKHLHEAKSHTRSGDILSLSRKSAQISSTHIPP